MGPFDDVADDFPPEATKHKPKKTNGEATTQFPYVWVNEASVDLSVRPLVKGLLEHSSFVLIYGPSGSGKSFFTADLAQHIATGASWRGRNVEQCLVVYVASEAGSSILKRFIAWRDNRMGEAGGTVPLAILTRGPNLLLPVEIEHLVMQLKVMQGQSGLRLGLVIFDTLSRSIPGGDENTAEHMTMVVKAGDILRDEFGCCTAFVHHSGKNIANGARGHSSLFAAADLVLCVEDKCALVEKVRDGVSGERFPFTLQPVEIGADADGDPVMSCLLTETDAPVGPKPKSMPKGQNQKIVLPVMRDYAHQVNERSTGTSAIPGGVLIVGLESLIEHCIPKFGGDDPDWRVREKIRDAIMGLQAGGYVGVHGKHVWLIDG